MDKSQSDILSEIKQTLDSLKAQIADIEAKLADIENFTEANEEPATVDFIDPIDISIDIDPFEPIPDLPAFEEPVRKQADGVAEGTEANKASEAAEAADGTKAAPAADTPQEAVREAVLAPVTEPVQKTVEETVPVQEPAQKTVEETAPVQPQVTEPAKEPVQATLLDDDMPEELLSPVESINDRQEKKTRKAVMDVIGAKCAWKTAIPGSPVKNVISAISLNDRVLFINTLFKEDPMAFQDAISAFNSMSTFAEAEAYVQEHHSDWNLNSDLVYRLMMAVRRKLK